MLPKPIKHAHVDRICPVCERAFWTYPSRVRYGVAHFCSKPCWYTFLRSQSAPARRFWASVTKSPGCWIRQTQRRYGHLKINGATVTAHRYAWFLASGTDPGDGVVCHTCDEPHCVRNDESGTYEVDGRQFPRFGHLFLADHKANTADAFAKGRRGHRAHDQ